MLCSCCSHVQFATSKGYLDALEAEETRRGELEGMRSAKRMAAAAKWTAMAAAKAAKKEAAADKLAAKAATAAAAAAGTVRNQQRQPLVEQQPLCSAVLYYICRAGRIWARTYLLSEPCTTMVSELEAGRLSNAEGR